MTHISAIFQNGVFKPLEPVTLPENQHVQIYVDPSGKEDPWDWFNRVCARQQTIAQREGMTFDSAVEIAKDRNRLHGPLVNVIGGDYPQIVLLRNWP